MGKLRRNARNLLLFLAAFGTAALAMGAIDGDPASFEFGAYLSSGSLALLSCNWRRLGRWRMAGPVPESRAQETNRLVREEWAGPVERPNRNLEALAVYDLEALGVYDHAPRTGSASAYRPQWGGARPEMRVGNYTLRPTWPPDPRDGFEIISIKHGVVVTFTTDLDGAVADCERWTAQETAASSSRG
jgi:hypothetical protein